LEADTLLTVFEAVILRGGVTSNAHPEMAFILRQSDADESWAMISTPINFDGVGSLPKEGILMCGDFLVIPKKTTEGIGNGLGKNGQTENCGGLPADPAH